MLLVVVILVAAMLWFVLRKGTCSNPPICICEKYNKYGPSSIKEQGTYVPSSFTLTETLARCTLTTDCVGVLEKPNSVLFLYSMPSNEESPTSNIYYEKKRE